MLCVGLYVSSCAVLCEAYHSCDCDYLPEVSLNKTKGQPVCEPLKEIPTSRKSPLFVEVVFNVVCTFLMNHRMSKLEGNYKDQR